MDGFFRSAMQAVTPVHAAQRVRELYGDVAIDGLRGYRERSAGDPRFTLVTTVFDGDIEIAADVRDVTISFGNAGHRWRTHTEEGDVSRGPALFQNGEPVQSRMSGKVGTTLVTFDTTSLSALAEQIYGEPTQARFEGARPATESLGRLWLETVRTVLTTDALDNDLARATVYRALGGAALEIFRLVRPAERRQGLTPRGVLGAYRRAGRFIDENLSLPISEADIAQAAGVSVAELRAVYAVESAGGWTPARHLRQARLAAAHVDLLDGDPSRGDRVTDIAARWGFTSSEKFGALYRAAFETTPGATLRS